MPFARAGLLIACVLTPALAGQGSLASAAEPRTVRATGSEAPLGNELLSDERRLTRYAYAVTTGPIRSGPSRSDRRVGRLHYLTEDGPLEVYLVLESRLDGAGRPWLRIRLPMRPNGRTGWVSADHLGQLRVVRTMLRVNRRTKRATLYRSGLRVWSSRIGIGSRSTPTPAGRFWIRTRLRSLRGDPLYGPYAFGTAAYSVLSDWPGGGVIGIHGTDRPDLIPGSPSHGCIRVPNAAITRLWRQMPVGTPVRVL